jgi:predicted RNA binding protein YcfA (HicA-like mRNA interferase family)
MPTLPLLRPSDVVRGFERLGWQVARQRASYIILRAFVAKAGLTVEKFLAAAL